MSNTAMTLIVFTFWVAVGCLVAVKLRVWRPYLHRSWREILRSSFGPEPSRPAPVDPDDTSRFIVSEETRIVVYEPDR